MEEDEEILCRYGTALPAFEEDAVPSKKPVTVEDQIVLDSNGKRRFHGAFTGGFSAGYWNTVGSEEGWKPTEFKSSRKEKFSSVRQQNPMDFMDEEDLGEFGIAPQRVQAKDDFAHSGGSSNSSKRKFELGLSKGPIPGKPVLRALLEPAKEKTAVKMLKKMGWREGQGIGERQTKHEKKQANARTNKEQYLMKMYGCEIPGRPSDEDADRDEGDDGSENSDSDYEVTFAPDDFDPLVASLKNNTFGLGYSGLDRGTSSSGFQLFDALEVVDKNNKKLSIRGQAFGIGALEDDDDLDVYARDDMSRYDFSLEDKKQTKCATSANNVKQQASNLEGFSSRSSAQKHSKKVFSVQMPDGFQPRNWEERRTRFNPLDEQRAKQIERDNEHKIKGLGRHDLCPKERGEILGEKSKPNPVLEMLNQRSNNFVSGEVIHNDSTHSAAETDQPKEGSKIVVKQEPPSSSSVPSGLVTQPNVLQRQYLGSTKEGFKPFIAMPDKQDRYDRFLAFQSTERYLTRQQYLESLQPLGLSAWDRERELKEFVQAERMYRPLDGLMSERFVTASSLIADKTIPADGESGKPREIRMQRTRVMWKPHKELCKRFNVPEPFGGMMADEQDAAEKRRKEKGKFSVFDYLETPVTNRRDFVTPVVIPNTRKHQHTGNESQLNPVAIKRSSNAGGAGQRLSSRDFFISDDTTRTSIPNTESEANSEDGPIIRTVNSSLPPPVLSRKTEKKRTELEEKVLQATNKKPEDKRDLFKSIFCSSDEEGESKPNSSSKEEKAPAEACSVLTDEEKLKMVDSFIAIKPASQVNILRNNSPPRGIFKNLFEFKQPPRVEREHVLQCSSKSVKTTGQKDAEKKSERHSSTSSDSEPDSASDSEDTEYYGPKLPTKAVDNLANYSEGQPTGAGDGFQHLLDGKERAKDTWIEKRLEVRRHSPDKGKKKKKHKQHHHKSKMKSKHKKEKKKSSHKRKSRH
ncbi:G patch domain-containing protein 1 homolog [Anopheles nili]|uniref:G patch domain-containing protein 1 homolog n=1 Tax=Anopheles nili TaxID=185578 RepID=UPI00237AC228|nr:G patch domain-containing protein 1 homolog [Anopheles nili]